MRHFSNFSQFFTFSKVDTLQNVLFLFFLKNIYIIIMANTIVNVLVKDELFIKSLEGHIKYIMEDGKIDIKDIPEIMILLTECYNNLSKFKLDFELLPDIFKELLMYIINKYRLVNENSIEEFNKMIDICIKLILIQPKVKKGCLKIKNILC